MAAASAGGLALVGIALTLPNLGLPQWSSPVQRPRLFEAGRYAKHVPADATALVLPYGPAGWSMLWQAEEGFPFRLVGGHFALRVTPAERTWRDVYEGLNAGRVAPQRLRNFLEKHCVDVVVVTPGTRGSARRTVEVAVGAQPVQAPTVSSTGSDRARREPALGREIVQELARSLAELARVRPAHVLVRRGHRNVPSLLRVKRAKACGPLRAARPSCTA